MYDAIIVGARVAGSPLAMLLARKGYRVLLLDIEDAPRTLRIFNAPIIFVRFFSRRVTSGYLL